MPIIFFLATLVVTAALDKPQPTRSCATVCYSVKSSIYDGVDDKYLCGCDKEIKNDQIGSNSSSK